MGSITKPQTAEKSGWPQLFAHNATSRSTPGLPVCFGDGICGPLIGIHESLSLVNLISAAVLSDTAGLVCSSRRLSPGTVDFFP